MDPRGKKAEVAQAREKVLKGVEDSVELEMSWWKT